MSIRNIVELLRVKTVTENQKISMFIAVDAAHFLTLALPDNDNPDNIATIVDMVNHKLQSPGQQIGIDHYEAVEIRNQHKFRFLRTMIVEVLVDPNKLRLGRMSERDLCPDILNAKSTNKYFVIDQSDDITAGDIISMRAMTPTEYQNSMSGSFIGQECWPDNYEYTNPNVVTSTPAQQNAASPLARIMRFFRQHNPNPAVANIADEKAAPII